MVFIGNFDFKIISSELGCFQIFCAENSLYLSNFVKAFTGLVLKCQKNTSFFRVFFLQIQKNSFILINVFILDSTGRCFFRKLAIKTLFRNSEIKVPVSEITTEWRNTSCLYLLIRNWASNYSLPICLFAHYGA